ncbi:MAG: helix-turn-helix domain-containing protein [Planctomycetaceae bacterium]
MIRASSIPDDDDLPAPDAPPPGPATSGSGARKPRGVPITRPGAPPELTYFTPAELAAMWGVAHDKVLEFIKTGELEAFNVASKRSRRPQFKVTLAAVKAFQERRSGRDPSRSAPPSAPRRRPSKPSQPTTREYF